MAETTIERPLLSQELKITQTILKKHIEPIFIPTTMLICDHHATVWIDRENENHLKHHALKRKSYDMSEQTEGAISKSNEAALSKVVLTLMRKEHNDLKKGLNKAIQTFKNAN